MVALEDVLAASLRDLCSPWLRPSQPWDAASRGSRMSTCRSAHCHRRTLFCSSLAVTDCVLDRFRAWLHHDDSRICLSTSGLMSATFLREIVSRSREAIAVKAKPPLEGSVWFPLSRESPFPIFVALLFPPPTTKPHPLATICRNSQAVIK